MTSSITTEGDLGGVYPSEDKFNCKKSLAIRAVSGK